MFILSAPGFAICDLIDMGGLYALSDERTVIAWKVMDIMPPIPITAFGEPDMDYLVIDPMGLVYHPHEGTSYHSTTQAIDTINAGE